MITITMRKTGELKDLREFSLIQNSRLKNCVCIFCGAKLRITNESIECTNCNAFGTIKNYERN